MLLTLNYKNCKIYYLEYFIILIYTTQRFILFNSESLMKLKTLSLLVLASSLTACLGVSNNTKTQSTPMVGKSSVIVYEEPKISAPFYALNPFNYELPPVFEVNLQKAAQAPIQAMEVSVAGSPSVILNQNKLIIPTQSSKDRAVKFAVRAGDNELDVTSIDDFLNILEGKARHYPTQFADRKERRGFEGRLKQVIAELDTLAVHPNASFDVLLRAYKANVMARNMDMGQIYITKSFTYGQRLVKLAPNDGEVNLWFGFSLAEGGAQKEAIPYLQKAMNANVQEAHLSLANAYLGMENKKNAITTLNNYKVKYPSEAEVVTRLVNEIQTKNRWNVWQILK